MNLNVFSTLAVSIPLSLALISACGGTADVGNDRANVNAAGSGNDTGGANGTGGDVVSPGTGGAAKAGSPGTGGDSQQGSGGSNQGGATGPGGAPAAGGMTGHAGSGAGGASGSTCGGLIGAQCGKGEWCDFADPICGAADGTGTCQPIPEVCDQLYKPVCGCDGNLYGNECMANMAGVDASSDTSCLAQDGGAGAQCTTDSDCRVADDYCHGGCDCVALSANEKAPSCTNPIACLVAPCSTGCGGGECTAHCDNGVCVAR